MPISSSTSPELREKRREYQRRYRAKRKVEDAALRITMQELFDKAGIVCPEPRKPLAPTVQRFIDQLES